MRDNIQQVIESLLTRLGSGTPGLALLPAVTGMGKTHAAKEMIIKQLSRPRAERQWKHIMYITPRKDNLPTELVSHHNPGDQKTVVFVNNLQENFLKHWNAVEDEIESCSPGINKEIFKRLDTSITMLNRPKSKDSGHEVDYGDLLREQFTKAERDFRKALKSALKKKLGKEFYTLGSRAMHEPDLEWIKKLYPAQVLEEADVIILSAKMAVGPLARVDSPAHLNDFLEDALVILDEFDSIKSVMLDDVVDAADRSRYNLLRTLRNLISALTIVDPPDIFPSSILNFWDELIAYLQKYYDQNHLRWQVKLSPELEDAARRFMASDFQFTTYIKGQNRINLVIKPDAERKTHIIHKGGHDRSSRSGEELEADSADDEQSLVSFLVGCRHIISRVAHAFRSAAEQRSRETGQDYDFIFEECFYSICNHFSLDAETRQTLLRVAQKSSIHKSGSWFAEPFRERTFFQKGLQVTEIIDSPRHSTHSRFQEISLFPVPETLLLDWCDKAQVLGMSATALRETAIGNFHLDTLRSHLGESRFIVPDQSDISLLSELYDQLFSRYKSGDVEIRIEKTDIPVIPFEPSQELKEVIKNDNLVFKIYRYLESKFQDTNANEKGYALSRYFRIVRSLCYFRDNPAIPSALFVLNTHPQDHQEAGVSKEVVESLIDALFSKESAPYFSIVRSKGFSDELKKIDQNLAAGQRVVAFSTYATIGKGVNIQHIIPPETQTVKINEYEKSDTMDWPMIHLDAPTNLLPALKAGTKFGKDNLKALMQFEYLVLCGALPYSATWKYFTAIFQNAPFEHPQHNELFNFTILEVVQALGRLSRTNMKAPVVHVLTERKLLERLRFDQHTDELTIPEYRKLLDEAYATAQKPSDKYQQDDLLHNALNITLEAEKKKRNLLSWVFKGKEDSIASYKLLRQTLLQQPVTDDIDKIPAELKSAYVKLPDTSAARPLLYFSKRKDRVSNLSFAYDEKTPRIFSEENSGLPGLMAVPAVRQYFADCGYAAEFGAGKWVLSPALFDIYKGALGEAAGKILLETLCRISLKELPNEHFEQFDYLLSANERIAIDFKMFLAFSVMTRKELDALLQKIDTKRSEVGLEKVYIINILAESEDAEFRVDSNPEYPHIKCVPFIIKGNAAYPNAVKYLTRELI